MTIHFSRYLANGSEIASQTDRGAELLASIPRDPSMVSKLSSLRNVISNLNSNNNNTVSPQTLREVLASSLL